MEGIGVSGMAQTSRDRRARLIPQPVRARTAAARRSGTRRARGCGGRGAPAIICKDSRKHRAQLARERSERDNQSGSQL